jgi:outer membrane protein OmpA-like peptidoglycan-associated protein
MQTRATAKETASHASKPFFGSRPVSSSSFFSPSPVIQAKLTMGAPGDPFEREADAIADRVVQRMAAGPVSAGSVPPVQAACAACAGSKEELRRKEAEGAGDSSGTAVDAEVASSIQSLSGGGSPLPGSVRAQLEPQFGTDFSGVRVHTDSQAHHLARSVNAHAFTHGQDIVFAPGRYAPHTTDGTRLLAHELTHVVQQRGANATLQRFAVCETGTACPPRASGELARSRTSPHRVEDFSTSTFAVLISNFAIDDARAKSDLHRDMTWVQLIAHMAGAAADDWEILGFTDCGGAESRNSALRQQRADEIAGQLPAATRAVVHNVTSAAITDCITTNATEVERNLNRAVLVRRRPGPRGPTVPAWTGGRIGPVRPAGTPADYCTPYTSAFEASVDRLMLESVFLNGVMLRFGPDVHALWVDYLSRPKGSSLTPRVFRGATDPIARSFLIDPATVAAQAAVFAEIAAALAHTPELNIPMSGASFRSAPIPLATLLPTTSLIRGITYTDPVNRIPGLLAGGSGTIGTGSSDAGPDLRVFSGSVVLERTRPASGPEARTAVIDLQLQVIDAVDFCPGNPGSSTAQHVTIPMSRLEATPTEPTYDLPFHVFVDLSGTTTVP